MRKLQEARASQLVTPTEPRTFARQDLLIFILSNCFAPYFYLLACVLLFFNSKFLIDATDVFIMLLLVKCS